jgi:riboflavin-specific deaminase-like protein
LTPRRLKPGGISCGPSCGLQPRDVSSAEPARLERFGPKGGRTTADESIRGFRLGDMAPPGRPYVALNMIASADGKATLGGRAGALGDQADREVFHHLRTQADAVMIGARTVAIEGYRRLVRDPTLREKRRKEGLAADPLACVVSGRLELPRELPLLEDESSRVVIVTAASGELDGRRAAQVEYLRTPTPPRLAPALARLRSDYGIRSILCEGGPTLNATLLAEGLVDELFLSIAPTLVGSADAATIVGGPPLPRPVGLEVLSGLKSDNHLFLRYRVAGRES